MGVLDYYDLLKQANLQDCDSRDESCVSGNVAKEAAVEDFWAAHQSTGVPDNTVLTFTPQTQAQVTEFYNPSNLNFGGNVVDDRGIMQVSGVPPVFQTNYPPSPAPAAPKPAVTTPPQATAIAPSQAVQPQGAPALSPSLSLPSVGGFDLSSVPLWGWAGAAVAGLFLLRGK